MPDWSYDLRSFERTWHSFTSMFLMGYHYILSSALAVMSYGISNAWTSPYLPYLISESSYIPTTTEEGSWCAVAPLIGCIIGAIVAANLADRIGRKYSILLVAPIVFFCVIGIGFVKYIWYLSALRFVIGITEGAVFTILPMYVGEIVDAKIRGALSSSVFVCFIIGTLVINAIGPVMDIFTSSLICAAIPALHFFTFMFMPESPYYYIKVKKYKQAEKSLKKLKGTDNVTKDMEVLQTAAASQEELAEKPKLTDMITIPSNRKACYIFLILCTTNKMTGKVAIMLYTTTIFQESGSTIDATLSVILYTAVELVFIIITTFFIIDRFGRKFLIIISTIGCGTSLFLLAAYFYIKDFHSGMTVYLDWLPITALVIYNIMFSIGLSFAPITYITELFPTTIKASALCIAKILAVLVSVLSSKFFQLIFDYFGSMFVPFLSFSICSWIGLVFIIKFVPETKGKTLEEIQELLSESKNKIKRKKGKIEDSE